MSIPSFEALFVIDANPAESCANVQVNSGGETSDVILNISTPANEGDPFCASGTLGTIPVTIRGVAVAFSNAVIRMTVSADGFSDGLVGATIGEANFGELVRHCVREKVDFPPEAARQIFDIHDDLSADTTECSALSATFEIGGVANQPTDQVF